jgi:hypothetical protein
VRLTPPCSRHSLCTRCAHTLHTLCTHTHETESPSCPINFYYIGKYFRYKWPDITPFTSRTSVQHSVLQAILKILLDFHFRSLKQPAGRPAAVIRQRPKSQLFFCSVLTYISYTKFHAILLKGELPPGRNSHDQFLSHSLTLWVYRRTE